MPTRTSAIKSGFRSTCLGFRQLHECAKFDCWASAGYQADRRIMIRDMTYLSVSFDHRVLDRAMAAEFMNMIKQYLEDPKLLLFEMD